MILASAHMAWQVKLRNIERDPLGRAVLRRAAAPGAAMNPHAMMRARAIVQSTTRYGICSTAWRRSISPLAPGTPPPKRRGYIVRYAVGRAGGVGSRAPTLA